MRKNHFFSQLGILLLAFLFGLQSMSAQQVWPPEGVNIPGAWNSWTNYPNPGPFLSNIHAGGTNVLISEGTRRYSTTFQATLTNSPFLFTSGPSGSPWNNKWGSVNVTMNTLQTYTFGGGNNSINMTVGKYYTANFKDNGYNNTTAIFMETTNEPISFTAVSQSPSSTSVFANNAVVVSITASAAPSPEELVYVRYSTDNYSTSTLVPVVFVGSTGTATIPQQAGGANISYYVFSTTVSNPSLADIHMYTYGYTVSSGNPSYNVTFQVNMSEQTVSANGVRIAGSFQGWDPAGTLMTDDNNDGIYTYTASLEEGSSVQYKFINGNDWPQAESVPGACSSGGNRSYTVGSSNATVDAVCFGKCYNCVGPQNVTFQVNMSTQSVSANGVHIAGNFQGWNPSATLMTDPDNDGIYTVTLPINGYSNLEYKFINGNAWGNAESVPGACNSNGNRTFSTGAGVEVIPVVCFGSCENCPTSLIPVTFQVNMNQQTVSANGVHVAGNFQGWNPGSTPLSDVDNDGIYSVTVNIAPNTALQYKFVNGNAWGSDESVSGVCNSGGNRSFTVSASGSDVIPVVCYGLCINCPSLQVNLTFQVDMSQQTVSANGVHIAGNFQGWNPSTTQMTDANNDGIYTYTATVNPETEIQYKFINGNDWPFSENVPGGCSNGGNRTYTTGTTDATITTVCYGSCSSCVAIAYCNVTFQVNMTQTTVSSNGVHIAGSFQGWNAGSTTMTDPNNDGIYTVTVSIQQGESIEYKFINGNAWGSDETVPSGCNSNGNRAYLVPSGANSTIGAVCFASCSNCCTPINYYLDNDGDGFGAGAGTMACSPPDENYVANNLDCNDSNDAANPEGDEVCGNGVDDDCAGGDLACPQVGPQYSVPVVNINQFGTGVQSTMDLNLITAGDSPQNAGTGNDRWFSFIAGANAIRIALTGSTAVLDDNEITLYNNPTDPNAVLVPIATEDDVHPNALGTSADAGNETLIFGGLSVGSTYYVCVRNTNATPGNCKLRVSYLRGSQADVTLYTGGTNIYTSVCQNFKSAFRANGAAYVVKRWAGNTITGSPEWSYTIPSGTICQLGRIVSANLSGSTVPVYVTVDVNYNLPDAFGNLTPVTANGTVMSNFSLASEGDLTVRTADICPAYKSISSAVSANRSVCGTQQYNWNFKQVHPIDGLPLSVNGPMGGSRILALSQITGIANNQRYDVKVRSMHFDATTTTAYGSVACVRTIGSAGMTTENSEVVSQALMNGAEAMIYPNPNNGHSLNLQINGMDGDVLVRVIDANGKLVLMDRLVVEGSLNTSLTFSQGLSNGLYQVEISSGASRNTMRLSVVK
jgi:1,4-alpha-glucan branching enzyme